MASFGEGSASGSPRVVIVSNKVVRPAFLPQGSILRRCLEKGARNYAELESSSSDDSLDAFMNSVYKRKLDEQDQEKVRNLAEHIGEICDDFCRVPDLIATDIAPAETLIENPVADLIATDDVEPAAEVPAEDPVADIIATDDIELAAEVPAEYPAAVNLQAESVAADVVDDSLTPPRSPTIVNDYPAPESPIIGSRRRQRFASSPSSISFLDTTFSQPEQKQLFHQCRKLVMEIGQKVEKYERRFRESSRRRRRIITNLQSAEVQMSQNNQILVDLRRQFEEIQRRVLEQESICLEDRQTVQTLRRRRQEAQQMEQENEVKFQRYKRQLRHISGFIR